MQVLFSSSWRRKVELQTCRLPKLSHEQNFLRVESSRSARQRWTGHGAERCSGRSRDGPRCNAIRCENHRGPTTAAQPHWQGPGPADPVDSVAMIIMTHDATTTTSPLSSNWTAYNHVSLGKINLPHRGRQADWAGMHSLNAIASLPTANI